MIKWFKNKFSTLKTNYKEASIENIYKLDGFVPVLKAIPFGLQHILAMFVANITPIIIVFAAIGLPSEDTAKIIQNAMFIAGIGTIIQLYPIWRIGGRLPIVVGISFTFVSVMIYIGTTYDYGTMLGSIIIGGLCVGVLGLFAKYWRKIISPLVSSCVVLGIGFSLLSVGASSFGGGSSNIDFGSTTNIVIACVTLLACLLFNIFIKGHYKNMSILLGLLVGYILSICLGVVDFTTIKNSEIIALPKFANFNEIKFSFWPIVTVIIIYIVGTTEAMGDVSALTYTGLGREVSEKELSGAIACDGFTSAISGTFGCLPLTTFSQNVGIVGMTKVINRFTILMGAIVMLLAGLFPILGAVLATLPDAVLGGCTIMLFGSIVVTGMQMIAKCGFTQRNMLIVSITIGMGFGFSLVPQIFAKCNVEIIKMLGENCVATMFIIALVLDLLIPKEKIKATGV